jgi:hypothetical protein
LPKNFYKRPTLFTEILQKNRKQQAMSDGIKTLAFAIHSAAIDLGGIDPECGRPIVHNPSGDVLWIVERQGDVIVAENLTGQQTRLCAADIDRPEYDQTIPPVKLSTGKIIRTFPHPDGYHYTPALMTDGEWNEFCGLSQRWHNTVHVESRELCGSSYNGPG